MLLIQLLYPNSCVFNNVIESHLAMYLLYSVDVLNPLTAIGRISGRHHWIKLVPLAESPAA